MSSVKGFLQWFRTPVNLVAGGLFLAGLLLSELDWGFLALCAVATFGPGILRELGWLRDKDEFELRAARRAGYHAYLAGGLMTFLLVALFRSQAGPDDLPMPIDHPSELVTAVLVVMWFTWLLSSLLAYWGPLRTVRRILTVFGAVWLMFNILAGEGNWKISVMQSLLAVPFFVLAWAAPRRPRVTGVLLLAASVGFFILFGLQEIVTAPLEMGRVVVFVLFIGPLLGSGAALLGGGREDED